MIAAQVLSRTHALAVIEQLERFADRHRVQAKVCLTGGNPAIHPHFFDVFRSACEKQMPVSILGNPIGASLLKKMVDISRPTYFRISLEGLAEHNDSMRGDGHFERSLASLRGRFGVRRHVMLTLTRDNLDQVLPLGDYLRDKVERFTFNRLSAVGQGASLRLPSTEQLVCLMKRYIKASHENPILGFKAWRDHFGRRMMGGCTGYGCGAAFNFVALLPDGEIHACRKFPSPIGHVLGDGREVAYGGKTARRYHIGSSACRFCRLRNVCGGCLAVSHGCGLDVLRKRDPNCFITKRAEHLAGL
jgi:selenobiotic family peptide radical SAM maturase